MCIWQVYRLCFILLIGLPVFSNSGMYRFSSALRLLGQPGHQTRFLINPWNQIPFIQLSR